MCLFNKKPWITEEIDKKLNTEEGRRIHLLYARIKEITQEKKARNIGKQIKNREGEFLKDLKRIQKEMERVY